MVKGATNTAQISAESFMILGLRLDLVVTAVLVGVVIIGSGESGLEVFMIHEGRLGFCGIETDPEFARLILAPIRAESSIKTRVLAKAPRSPGDKRFTASAFCA
jgi:hypothetical protein